jgi:hypothetical protein
VILKERINLSPKYEKTLSEAEPGILHQRKEDSRL